MYKHYTVIMLELTMLPLPAGCEPFGIFAVYYFISTWSTLITPIQYIIKIDIKKLTPHAPNTLTVSIKYHNTTVGIMSVNSLYQIKYNVHVDVLPNVQNVPSNIVFDSIEYP